MNCYRIYMEEKAQKVRRGETVTFANSKELLMLQEFALDIKDIALYDALQKYWQMLKAGVKL